MKIVAPLAILLLATAPALAAPELKAGIVVNSDLVTVADLFDDAGALGETALFRAPAPGTTGFVAIEDVREAARRAGILTFEATGIVRVEVSREGAVVDEALLVNLIESDLAARGILEDGVTASVRFSRFVDVRHIAGSARPATLVSLRYLPQADTFAARFQIAGDNAPLDIDGRIELEIEVPHLARNLPAGAIIGAGDVEMRRVSLKFAESNGFARAEDLVGKALNRQTRAGMALRTSDVSEPRLVGRNGLVTLVFRSGALTLTARGKSLGEAGRGETVSVLNTTSNKIVQGVVIAPGTVEIGSGSTAVAGL